MVYCYKCPNCNYTSEINKTVDERNSQELCCICAQQMVRDFQAERPNVGVREYGTSFVSDSLAIHPEQIPEHNKNFPDVDVLPDGRISFRDTRQHSDYLKKSNFEKVPQRLRKHTTKVK